MNALTLADVDMNHFIHGFSAVAGAIVAVVILAIVIEAIAMIPDLIRTIKIHMM